MSHNVLSVEIEHTRYKTLLDDRKRVDGSVRLTTIQAHQNRAVISVYHERQGKRSPITDFEFIPPRGTSEEFPDLRLEGSWTGKNHAHLRLFHNGRLYAERSVRLAGRSLLPVAIPLGLLLLLGGLWLMWPSPPTETEARSRTATRGAPVAGEAATESPRTRPPDARPDQPVDEPPAAPPAEQPPAATEAPATVTPESPEPGISEPREYELVVYFRPDSAQITAHAAQELRAFAAQLPTTPATYSRISGHAALAGPPAGRLPLSRQRAEAVSAKLLTAGVQLGSDVQVRGFGAEQPLTRNPELQDENRRVEVELRYPPSNRR